jgi:hypothetical protein
MKSKTNPFGSASLAVDRLRTDFKLSVRVARALVAEFGESTMPADWASDYRRVITMSNAGEAARREILACLKRLGLPESKPLLTFHDLRPSPIERLTSARKSIENTVRRMGGKIHWVVSVEEVAKKRSKKRNRTVAKWRAKKALEEMNQIALTAANEGRQMTPAERSRFDKLMNHTNII